MLTPEREQEIREAVDLYDRAGSGWLLAAGEMQTYVRDLLAALDEHRRVGDALAKRIDGRVARCTPEAHHPHTCAKCRDEAALAEWRKLRGQHEGEA